MLDTSARLLYDKINVLFERLFTMNIGGKKLFLIGFLVVLLVGIPLTVYLLQQSQEVRTRAEKSTVISFSPDSTQVAPITKNVGDTIPLDITVDPGKNLVSFVKLEIQYDPEVLATDSANAFQANITAFPSVVEGPLYTPGKIAVTLAIGPDVTKAIQTKVKAATVTFKALKNTPTGTPTQVSFGVSPKTQVLSLGENDQASEDVLSSATPALIAIGGTAPTQPIPSGSPTPTTEVPSPEPTVETPTAVPTLPVDVPTATPTTPQPTGGPGTPNTLPICNSLVSDRAASGNAPFAITFTANGSDTDGTISKVTFNFGDGQQSDVTASGGIGTAAVNVQASHTYNNPGTYQATAILTDSASGVSTPNDNCKATITVSSTTASSSGGTGGGNTTYIAPTGSFENSLIIGAAVLMLVIGGGLIFFIL